MYLVVELRRYIEILPTKTHLVVMSGASEEIYHPA